MSNLPVVSTLSDLSETRVQRQASRQIAVAQAHGLTVSASEAAKVEAIAEVTEIALISAAHISAIETLLMGHAPHAQERLRIIAEAGCSGMAEIVFGMSQRV